MKSIDTNIVMVRYFKIIFFLITLLGLSSTAKCAAIGNNVSSQLLVNKPHLSHACSISSMKGNVPNQNHNLLLFRNGLDEKGFVLSQFVCNNAICISVILTDKFKVNTGLVKYVLTFSHYLTIPPEFLSSFSYHAPPVC